MGWFSNVSRFERERKEGEMAGARWGQRWRCEEKQRQGKEVQTKGGETEGDRKQNEVAENVGARRGAFRERT